METLKKQSIAQALRENFTSYPEDYSENAILQIVNWVENEYQNDEEEDKGIIGEWFTIAINEYLSYFETGENREHLMEQISFLRS